MDCITRLKPLRRVKNSNFGSTNVSKLILILLTPYSINFGNFLGNVKPFVVKPNKEYFFKGSKEGYESEEFTFNTLGKESNDTLNINYPMWPIEELDVANKEDTLVEEEEKQVPELEFVEKDSVVVEYLMTDEQKHTPGFVFKNVLHDFDIAAHSSGSGINIDDVIIVMNENPWLVISIESHTDSKGSEEYNMRLSKNRAIAVKEYLVQKGVASNRLKTKGHGEQYPIASNQTAEGREANRRVEIVVMK